MAVAAAVDRFSGVLPLLVEAQAGHKLACSKHQAKRDMLHLQTEHSRGAAASAGPKGRDQNASGTSGCSPAMMPLFPASLQVSP